jgi:hypothetical protein
VAPSRDVSAAYTAGMALRRAGLVGLLVALLLGTGWTLAPDADDSLPAGLYDGADDAAWGTPPPDLAPPPSPVRPIAGGGDTGRIPVPTRAAHPRPAPLAGSISRAPPPA